MSKHSATTVKAYTYEGDIHCPECAHQRFCPAMITMDLPELDFNWVPVNAKDKDGKPIQPVFDLSEHATATDESRSTGKGSLPPVCGTCREEIQ